MLDIKLHSHQKLFCQKNYLTIGKAFDYKKVLGMTFYWLSVLQLSRSKGNHENFCPVEMQIITD